MRKNPFTPDIIIETLKRTKLPTILVEGTDDVLIYREFENKIGCRKIDFIHCGGRNTVLEIFKRRNEFSTKKVMYIADRDMWVFIPIPTEYSDVYFTTGYSIENDLYTDGEDLFANIFSDDEKLRLNTILSNVIRWFAFEIDKFMNNQSYDANFSSVSLLDPEKLDRNTNELTTSFLTNRGFSEPNQNTLLDLKNNIYLKFRGKFLFQLIELIFQSRTNNITYSRKQLFNLCFIEGTRNAEKNTNMNRLFKTITEFLK